MQGLIINRQILKKAPAGFGAGDVSAGGRGGLDAGRGLRIPRAGALQGGASG